MSSFLKRLFGRRQSTEQAEKAVPPESLPQQSDAAEPVEPVAVDSFDIDVAATSAVTTPEKADVLQSEAPQSDNNMEQASSADSTAENSGLVDNSAEVAAEGQAQQDDTPVAESAAEPAEEEADKTHNTIVLDAVDVQAEEAAPSADDAEIVNVELDLQAEASSETAVESVETPAPVALPETETSAKTEETAAADDAPFAQAVDVVEEAGAAEREDAAVDEFEIGMDMLAQAAADTPATDTAPDTAEETLDADAIKAAVQAMQQESGETIFEFADEHTADADSAQHEASIATENSEESEAAFSIDVVDLYADDEQHMGEQIPPLLQADTETVDAGEIEAEMLAMEEAANGPPIEPPLPDTKQSSLQEKTNEPAESTPVAEAEAASAEESSAENAEPKDHSVGPEETASAETNEAETVATVTEEETPQKTGGWAARLKEGLSKSRDHMAKSLASVFGGGQIDEDLYEELETVLLTSDMGIEATEKLMDEVRRRVSLSGLKDGNELRQTLKEAVRDLLSPLEQPLTIPEGQGPFVIMMAGINGAGKTTSIGKLAKYFQAQGKSVLLAAGDTFRAAAREQLQEWGRRNGVTVISQESADSAAVCFDALEAAKARKIDIVLADTAGRLPTQLHLMEEIKKVKRVLQKAIPDAPHEVMVVLDANIGQNAVNQVAAFDEALGVTGLVVTKLDGTAKGGVLAALAERGIPVRFIGVGEKIDDLRPFDTEAFVEALFEDEQA